MYVRSGSLLVLAGLVTLTGCNKGEGSGLPFQTVGKQPDVAPVMLNKELPFRYPPALYAQKVQGNVTLRIYIDREGSRDLTFEPAKTQGQPVPVSILLPVYFRHPDAPPLAGDAIIKRDSTSSLTDTTGPDTAAASAAKAAPKKPARRATTKRKTR